MKKSLDKLIQGYQTFKKQYASGDQSIMQRLAYHGQKPECMIISCCDSRVDPSLIFQMDPGDLFVVRNVANIVPPYEADDKHHGTSAALEFGVCYLHVKHLIILGHSQCGGIQALLNSDNLHQNDFISNWVSLIELKNTSLTPEIAAKKALLQSYKHCLTFPWLKERIDNQQMAVHLWYFDIETAAIDQYDFEKKVFEQL